jgi:hypothetical protein
VVAWLLAIAPDEADGCTAVRSVPNPVSLKFHVRETFGADTPFTLALLGVDVTNNVLFH